MGTQFMGQKAKKYGSIALFISILQLIFPNLFLYLKIRPALFFSVLFFYWAIPFLIVYRVEKRDLKSLGIILIRDKIVTYALYAAIGFTLSMVSLIIEVYFRIHFTSALPQEVFSFRRNLFVALMIQITTVSLPEELFFRGYLLTRLGSWLGSTKGLVLSSFLFAVLHMVSRISQYGFNHFSSVTLSGISSLAFGLILGYQYLKTESVLVPAISHISLDLFGLRIIKILL